MATAVKTRWVDPYYRIVDGKVQYVDGYWASSTGVKLKKQPPPPKFGQRPVSIKQVGPSFGDFVNDVEETGQFLRRYLGAYSEMPAYYAKSEYYSKNPTYLKMYQNLSGVKFGTTPTDELLDILGNADIRDETRSWLAAYDTFVQTAEYKAWAASEKTKMTKVRKRLRAIIRASRLASRIRSETIEADEVMSELALLEPDMAHGNKTFTGQPSFSNFPETQWVNTVRSAGHLYAFKLKVAKDIPFKLDDPDVPEAQLAAWMKEQGAPYVGAMTKDQMWVWTHAHLGNPELSKVWSDYKMTGSGYSSGDSAKAAIEGDAHQRFVLGQLKSAAMEEMKKKGLTPKEALTPETEAEIFQARRDLALRAAERTLKRRYTHNSASDKTGVTIHGQAFHDASLEQQSDGSWKGLFAKGPLEGQTHEFDLSQKEVLEFLVDSHTPAGGGKDSGSWEEDSKEPALTPYALMAASVPWDGSKVEKSQWLKANGGNYTGKMDDTAKTRWMESHLLGNYIGEYQIELAASMKEKGKGGHRWSDTHPGSPESPAGKKALQTLSNLIAVQPWSHLVYGDKPLDEWPESSVLSAYVSLRLYGEEGAYSEPAIMRDRLRKFFQYLPELPDPVPGIGPVQSVLVPDSKVSVPKPEGISDEAWEFMETIDSLPGDYPVFEELAPDLQSLPEADIAPHIKAPSYTQNTALDKLKYAPLNIKRAYMYARGSNVKAAPAFGKVPQDLKQAIEFRLNAGYYDPPPFNGSEGLLSFSWGGGYLVKPGDKVKVVPPQVSPTAAYMVVHPDGGGTVYSEQVPEGLYYEPETPVMAAALTEWPVHSTSGTSVDTGTVTNSKGTITYTAKTGETVWEVIDGGDALPEGVLIVQHPDKEYGTKVFAKDDGLGYESVSSEGMKAVLGHHKLNLVLDMKVPMDETPNLVTTPKGKYLLQKGESALRIQRTEKDGSTSEFVLVLNELQDEGKYFSTNVDGAPLEDPSSWQEWIGNPNVPKKQPDVEYKVLSTQDWKEPKKQGLPTFSIPPKEVTKADIKMAVPALTEGADFDFNWDLIGQFEKAEKGDQFVLLGKWNTAPMNDVEAALDEGNQTKGLFTSDAFVENAPEPVKRLMVYALENNDLGLVALLNIKAQYGQYGVKTATLDIDVNKTYAPFIAKGATSAQAITEHWPLQAKSQFISDHWPSNQHPQFGYLYPNSGDTNTSIAIANELQASEVKEFTDLLATAAPVSAPKLVFFPIGDKKFGGMHSKCVDTETEILTARGWLTVDDVRMGDLALSLDPDSGVGQWQEVERVSRFQHEGEVLVMEGARHSSVSTLYHRWLVQHRGEFRWRTSDSLVMHDAIPCVAPCETPVEAKYSDDFVELVAWFWTEGSINPYDGVIIGQSLTRNPLNVARIRAALGKVYGPPRERLWKQSAGWRESRQADGLPRFHLNKSASRALLDVAPDRVVQPAFVTALTKAQLELFLEVSVAGDGCTVGQTVLSQATEARLSPIQMACVLAGRQTNLRRDGDHGWLLNIYRSTGRRSGGFVWPKNAAHLGKRFRMEVRPYSGEVWCPTLKNGTWFARRRGTVYVTGNSYWKDQSDREYLSKAFPNDPNGAARVDAEHNANRIGRLHGFHQPRTYALGMNKFSGDEAVGYSYVQEIVPGTKIAGLQPWDLEDNLLFQLAEEHLLDWIVSNHDSHDDNFIRSPDGLVLHGVDKGQAFKHFPNDKLAIGYRPPENPAPVFYDDVYKGIISGNLDKERADRLVEHLLKRARRIAKLHDASHRSLLEQAMEKRQSFPAGMTREQFVDALMERKKNLPYEFEAFYQSVYKQAGVEWTLPPVDEIQDQVVESTQGRVFVGVSPELLTDVKEAQIQGVPAFFSSDQLEDAHLHFWEEREKDGGTLLVAEGRLREAADAKVTAWLAAQTVEDESGVSHNTPTPAAPTPQILGATLPKNDVWYSHIVAAAKTVNHHANDGEYNQGTLTTLGQTKKEIQDNLTVLKNHEQASPQEVLTSNGWLSFETMEQQKAWKGMANAYLDYIDEIETARANGVKTYTDDANPTFYQKYEYTAKPIPQTVNEWSDQDGLKTIKELSDGKWVIEAEDPATHELSKQTLTEAEAKALLETDEFASGVTVETDTIVDEVKVFLRKNTRAAGLFSKDAGVLTRSGGESEAGYPGQEFDIHVGEDLVIEYRPHSGYGNVPAQQGLLRINVGNFTGDEAQVEKAFAMLREMGLDLEPADEESLELFYWRHLYGIAQNRKGHNEGNLSVLLAAIKKAYQVNPNMAPAEELQMLKEAWATYLGTAKVEGANWMPQVGHQRLHNQDVTTGRPYWLRPDVTPEQVLKWQQDRLIHHYITSSTGLNGESISSDEGLFNVVVTGGLFSTEERSRMFGRFIGGMSSGSDQNKGSSAFIFTRLNQSPHGNVGLWLRPEVFMRTSNYSFTDDSYGNPAARKGNAPWDLAQSSKFKDGTNETMVKFNLSLLDDMEVVVFQSADWRAKAIAFLKDQGITEIRGIPVEERIITASGYGSSSVVATATKKAIEKLKETWASGEETSVAA